jgi:thiol-activated cytolysin
MGCRPAPGELLKTNSIFNHKRKKMKTKKHFGVVGLILSFMIICCMSCTKEDVLNSPCNGNCDADEINELIANLNYDAEEMLNVQNTNGTPSKREISSEESSPPKTELGVETNCITRDYSLATNFDEVAILRPTNGIIWPGALVIGNSGVLDGLPDPLTLNRAPLTLSIDLPGIGENGTIVVENPSNSSVQTGIDNALEYWNANAYQDGYVNAANSSYQVTTSYSSKQLSLDVGLNVEWATGDISSQFDYSSSEEKRVAMMVFKQVFYTITMDTPAKPADVFAADVSLSEIENELKSDTPPAYVQSVSYGRIIMFRMETTEEATDSELEATFNYAAGITVSANLEAKYKAILAKSSITTVTIGGNAAVASEAISAREFGDLDPIIKGENAVYSRNNPGVPIAYTIRYLKDNTFAKMGYTTEYAAKNCNTNLIVNQRINYKNDARVWVNNKKTKTSDKWPGWARVFMQYKKPNSTTIVETKWIEDIIVGGFATFDPPAGAHDIRIYQEYYFNCFGCYPGWIDRNYVTLGTTPQETFVESWYDDNSRTMKIYKTDKFRD